MKVRMGAVLVATMVVIGGGAGAAQKVPAQAQVAKVEVVNTVQISEVEKPAQPDPTVAPCAKGYEDRNSDLCAQWKAADAAEKSEKWALVAAVIAALTLGAVVIGFIQNRGLQKQEYRAYLGVEPQHHRHEGTDVLTLDFRLFNYGRTPAKQVHTRVFYEVANAESPPDWEGKDPISDPTDMSIHPGADMHISVSFSEFPLTDANIARFLRDGLGFFAFVSIFYEDVFGGKHECHCNVKANISVFNGKFVIGRHVYPRDKDNWST